MKPADQLASIVNIIIIIIIDIIYGIIFIIFNTLIEMGYLMH